MTDNTNIIRIATEEGISPGFVLAIIQTESSGNPFAWRTEPDYRYLWDVRNNQPFRKLRPNELNNERAPEDFHASVGSRNTEFLGQQASWGPMQVMGAVARELGFKGWFPELCGDEGIRYGCKLLVKLQKRFFAQGGYEAVAAAYNAGSPITKDGKYVNQDYVDKVINVFRDNH